MCGWTDTKGFCATRQAGKGYPVIGFNASARLRRTSARLALALAGLAILSTGVLAQERDLSFLGRYTLEPDCAGEQVRLQDDRFVVADLVCEVAEIDSADNGTFELSLSACVQDGEPTRGNAVFGYAIDGDAVALSFWGPIIPVHRCEG